MKNIVIVILVLLLILAGWYLLIKTDTTSVDNIDNTQTDEQVNGDETPIPVEPDGGIGDGAGPLPVVSIGASVEGRDIEAHRFGEGDVNVLVVGGIHGAYSPNTVALAERIITEAEEDESFVPEGVTLHVVPDLNPDGSAVGRSPEGRFNANRVDLNRNFDCEWSAEGVWRNQPVSGGDQPFSEPEAEALRNYVAEIDPDAAIVFYAAAGGVYASNCGDGVSDATLALADTYADASGYPTHAEFDFYAITGDAVNWMAGEGIPAVSVLLSDHSNMEWTKNRSGLQAVLESLTQQ